MTDRTHQFIADLFKHHPFDLLDTVKQLESGYANFAMGSKQYIWYKIDNNFAFGLQGAYRPRPPAYGCVVFHDGCVTDEMVFEIDDTFIAQLKKYCEICDDVTALLPQPIAEEVVPEIYSVDIVDILTIISAPDKEKMAAWGLANRPPEPDAWFAVSRLPE